MNKGGKTYYSLKESNELIVPDFHHYFAKQSLAVLILVVKGWAVDDLAHVRFCGLQSMYIACFLWCFIFLHLVLAHD